MSKKTWILVALIILLGGLSLYLNKDWFAGDDIQIFHRSRPVRGGSGRHRADQGPESAINPITFGIDRKLKLTCLKVIPVSAIETNKYPQPIWHLVSESNSPPIKEFSYGTSIPGMHPAIKGATPDPLEPGAKYRLLVESGSIKVQHDFVPVPRTP